MGARARQGRRAGRCLAARRADLAAQVTTILSRQLPRPLHAPLSTARRALLTAEQEQSAVQICAGTPQNIALAEQCRDVARHVRQPQRLTAQQQMGDARMCRQFGHGLTVGGQRLAFECAQALQQIRGLGISRCRRHIEPDQFARRDAPACV